MSKEVWNARDGWHDDGEDVAVSLDDRGRLATYSVGQRVRFFDPRTLGVIHHGDIVTVGRKYLHIDTIFTAAGSAKTVVRVLPRDIVEVVTT